MRLLFISQLFDPEYSIKGMSLMRRLAADGHEIQVLTTFPNYPTGKVFPGYSVKFKKIEEIDGVKIIRLWSYISHSNSKISRAISYLSFSIFAFFFSILKRKPDLVYCYHPQFTTGLIGLAMLYLRKVPYITDIQDLWPDALIATGFKNSGISIKVINFWCSIIYKNASRIVVLSNGYKKNLQNRGVDADKIDVVYNWCPEELQINKTLKIGNKKNQNIQQPVANFVYAGNIGSAQSLETLVMALGAFDNSILSLSFIGDGVHKDALMKFVAEKKFTNIYFKDYVPSSEIFGVLHDADILIVHLREDSLFRITIPSKTQSSMAMGKPLLMVVGGEANQIVIDAKAGEVADPGNIEEISYAAKRLTENRKKWPQLGNNARKFYERNFSMDVGYKKIQNAINKAVI